MGRQAKKIQRMMERENIALLTSERQKSIIQQRADLFRNGITKRDVQKAYDEGRKDAFAEVDNVAYKVMTDCFAAIMLVMHDKGKSRDEAIHMIADTASMISREIDRFETAEKILEDYGVVFDWNDPCELIKIDKNWKPKGEEL